VTRRHERQVDDDFLALPLNRLADAALSAAIAGGASYADTKAKAPWWLLFVAATFGLIGVYAFSAVFPSHGEGLKIPVPDPARSIDLGQSVMMLLPALLLFGWVAMGAAMYHYGSTAAQSAAAGATKTVEPKVRRRRFGRRLRSLLSHLADELAHLLAGLADRLAHLAGDLLQLLHDLLRDLHAGLHAHLHHLLHHLLRLIAAEHLLGLGLGFLIDGLRIELTGDIRAGQPLARGAGVFEPGRVLRVLILDARHGTLRRLIEVLRTAGQGRPGRREAGLQTTGEH